MKQIKSFEYAIAIAEAGSISQAAERLGISQPTLSKYIKKLEGEIGLELFDRSVIPLRPTEAGESYISYGKRFIDLSVQLDKQLVEIKSKKSSLVRIGISPSRSPYMIPAIIEAYKKSRPDGRVMIAEKTTRELSESLSRGELDVIISIDDEETNSFEMAEIYNEKIFLAAPKGFINGLDATTLMRTLPIISVGKGQSMRRTLTEISNKLGAPAPEIECQSIESGLALVKRGLGVMLAPSYIKAFSSPEHLSKIEFLPFSEEISRNLTRKVCVFYRKEQFLTSAERDFIFSVKRSVKE